MRAVLSGGGTAGHINPAISVAKKIIEKEPDSKLLFVGTPNGMENTLVGKEGFDIAHVTVQGFKRKLTLSNIRTAYLAFSSVYKAKAILKSFKPDVVIGTGGYVCWPILRAASKLGIPTLVHEQNADPGLTVAKLSKYVDAVATSFAETAEKLPCDKSKVTLCGNPVSPKIGKISRSASRAKLGISAPFILSYGGSLGARVINENVLEMMKTYSSKKPVFHTHAFGRFDYEDWQKKCDEAGICRFGNVRVGEYIFDMPEEMSAADIVISRAGAMTLSELSLLGKPAILIPSPNVTNNHQYKNAKIFHDAGAAVMIEEKDLTPELLVKTVDELIHSPEKLRKMSEAMKKLANPGADDRIYSLIRKIMKK